MSFKSDMLEELKSLIETFEKCDDNLSDAPNLIRCFFAAEDIAFAAIDYNRLRGRSRRLERGRERDRGRRGEGTRQEMVDRLDQG